MARIIPADIYYGSYVRFDTTSSREGAQIDTPNNAVGDVGEIVLELGEHKDYVAWLKNQYGDIIGFLDRNASHKVEIFKAKGWTVRYVLSFCACSMNGAEMKYWGQVALIAYSSKYAHELDEFVRLFAERAGEGFRPDPQLSADELTRVLSDPKSWNATTKVKIPRGGKGTAILKDHRTNHDKLLDQARKGNKGCYVIGYGFIGFLIAIVALLLNKLGIF